MKYAREFVTNALVGGCVGGAAALSGCAKAEIAQQASWLAASQSKETTWHQACDGIVLLDAM
jgi:hypothetical protein